MANRDYGWRGRDRDFEDRFGREGSREGYRGGYSGRGGYYGGATTGEENWGPQSERGRGYGGREGVYGGRYAGERAGYTDYSEPYGRGREWWGPEGWGREQPGGYGGEPYYGRSDWESGYYGGRYAGPAYGRYGAPGEPYSSGYGAGAYGGYGGVYGGSTGARATEGRRSTYAGRGPKGWRRSDERIREDVSEALARHPDIDASDLEVRVENGEVTLSGVVEDRREKRLAEDIAEDVFGVEDVHNELKIRHGFLAGLTGEKADEREVGRTAQREGAGATAGTTGARTSGTRAGGRTSGAGAT